MPSFPAVPTIALPLKAFSLSQLLLPKPKENGFTMNWELPIRDEEFALVGKAFDLLKNVKNVKEVARDDRVRDDRVPTVPVDVPVVAPVPINFDTVPTVPIDVVRDDPICDNPVCDNPVPTVPVDVDNHVPLDVAPIAPVLDLASVCLSI
jgi:hypothetical protein